MAPSLLPSYKSTHPPTSLIPSFCELVNLKENFTPQVGLLVSNKHGWHLFLDLISLMKGTQNAPQPITLR